MRCTLIALVLAGSSCSYELTQAETKQENHPVAKYESLEDLAATCSTIPQGSDDLFEGMHHPTYVQYTLDAQREEVHDCEDFAAYIIVAARKSRLVEQCWLGSVNWWKGRYRGHAVALCKTYDERFFWASNWMSCVPQWLESKDDWVDDLQRHSGHDFEEAKLTTVGTTTEDTLLLKDVEIVRLRKNDL